MRGKMMLLPFRFLGQLQFVDICHLYPRDIWQIKAPVREKLGYGHKTTT